MEFETETNCITFLEVSEADLGQHEVKIDLQDSLGASTTYLAAIELLKYFSP